jgi:alpha-tubulin suppressor-like RCC1 family protein
MSSAPIPSALRTVAKNEERHMSIGRLSRLSIGLARILCLLSLIIATLSEAAHGQPGSVMTWGLNNAGQLGDGTATDRTSPVSVAGLNGVIGIGAGNGHTVALLSDGTVRAWGFNFFGSLGDGTTITRTTPVPVVGLSGVVAIAVGGLHSLALLGDGTVRAWGFNQQGQLGNNTFTDSTTPVVVSGLSGVVAIAAGAGHSLALLSDGTVRTWGANTWFQLGDGTTTNRSTPVSSTGLSGVVGIAGGGNHSLALLGDGSVRAWGYNEQGQLGHGTMTLFSTTPVAVADLTDVVQISAGADHSVGLLSDGTVRTWGQNGSGELGDGTTLDRSAPVVVSGLDDVVEVLATGGLPGSHNLARRADGTLKAWGYNAWGQLGDGTMITRTVPVDVVGVTGASAIAGSRHSVAIIPPPAPPVTANAGPDQTVSEGEIVQLDGSASGGTGLTFSWEQLPGGPAVSLSTPTSATPSFTAPALPGGFGSQTLTFRLTVTSGDVSSVDNVTVTVLNVNSAPVAEASGPAAVNEGSLVSLDGSTSFDPDGDPIMSIVWEQVAGPPVALNGADTATPSFTAPLLAGGIGSADILTFRLSVSDGVLSATDDVTVTVEQVNHPPTANAGPNQTRDENSLVTLDGSASGDPDNDSLVLFTWTQLSGTPVALSDADSPMPTFFAPSVGPGGEALVFRLVVSDGALESVPDGDVSDVTITVRNLNDPPSCHAAVAAPTLLWPPNHSLRPVTIVGTSDPNGDHVAVTVTAVTQDEPVNGLGDGDTAPDAVILEDALLLRAERRGNGNGRVYEVHFVAADGQGGSCSGVVTVGVPHSMKAGGSATNDGAVYDSTPP